MKKIIPILCVCFVFITSCSDKKTSTNGSLDGSGDILLSLSSVGINFLDFPFTVKSIMLAHESGKNIELTEGFSINLASFGERPEYILTKRGVPAGVYTRIVITLAFTDKDKVTYFDSSQSDKPVTTHLISQTGKKLGVDHKNFMVNMPFFGKDLSVRSGETTHLDVTWNLNASTEIMAPADRSGEGWLIEFKPLVQARAIDQTTEMRVQGRIESTLAEGLVLQTPFDATENGKVTLSHKNASRFTLNGKATDVTSVGSVVNTETYVSIVADMNIVKGRPRFSAKVVNYFEKATTLLKGIVLAKSSTMLDIFGSKVSSADAITQSKKMYKLPAETLSTKERVYDVFSSIGLKLPTADFEALTGPSTSANGALQGPDDVVVLGKKTEVPEEKKKDGTPLKEDVFYLTVTESNLTASSESSREVHLLSNNGITLDEKVVAQLASTIKVEWVAGALWRGTGYFKTSGNDEVLILSTLIAVNAKATNTYKYDFKYEGNSIFDFADENDEHPTIVSELKTAAVLKSGKVEDKSSGKKSSIDNYEIKITNKLTFSKAVSFSGGIKCKSIPTGLGDAKTDFEEGQATVIFELMQNKEEWSKIDTFGDRINEAEFEGDFSTADIFTSNLEMQSWFDKTLASVEGKKLLVHSATIITDASEDVSKLSGGGHCDIKPSYILIRWIVEGTILDAYKLAFQDNKLRDVGIGTGLFFAASLGALAMYAAYMAIKLIDNRRMKTMLKVLGYDPEHTFEYIETSDDRKKMTLTQFNELTDEQKKSQSISKDKKTTLSLMEFKKLSDSDFSDEAIKSRFGKNLTKNDIENIKFNLKNKNDLPDSFKNYKLRVK